MLPSLGTTLSTGACGQRDPDSVWTAYATPALWPSWSPQVRAVHCPHPDVPVRAGTRGEVLGPGGARVPFEVTEVDHERRRWTWRVRVGVLVLQMTHGVATPSDGGSCAWLRVSGPLPVVAGYLPLARLALGRLVRGAETT
jgi:uncharacterized protein YndB with AHSA1/START domain